MLEVLQIYCIIYNAILVKLIVSHVKFCAQLEQRWSCRTYGLSSLQHLMLKLRFTSNISTELSQCMRDNTARITRGCLMA